MKNPFLRPFLAGLGLALLAASPALAENPATAPTPTPPSVNTPRDADALKTYAYAQRADFTAKVRAAAARLDSQITVLAKRQKGGVAGGGHALALEDLQSARTELGHQMGKLDDVPPENWEAVRDSVLASLTQTQIACEKAAQA
jgi:hypothetical protein